MNKRDRQRSMFRNAILNGLIDKRTLPHPLTRKQRAAMEALSAKLEADVAARRNEELPF